MEPQELADQLRGELQVLARDQGLTPFKLEGSRLLTLVARSGDLRRAEAAQALYRLIVEVVADLPSQKERQAARATMNVGRPNMQGLTALARQAELAKETKAHPDTVRRWWRRALDSLVELLPERINQLNNDPPAWDHFESNIKDDADNLDEKRPRYSFDQVDIIWRLRGRVAIEMITFRRLIAREDGVDHVNAKGWYFSDPSPDSCEIVPLLNCMKSASAHVGRGIQLAELRFAEALEKGQQVFYGYKVLVHSQQEIDPLFYHHVTSAGVRQLNIHVQFDSTERPAMAWGFASRDDAEPLISPPDGSQDYLAINHLGYLKYSAQNCRHGVKHGVSWRWQRGGD